MDDLDTERIFLMKTIFVLLMKRKYLILSIVLETTDARLKNAYRVFLTQNKRLL